MVSLCQVQVDSGMNVPVFFSSLVIGEPQWEAVVMNAHHQGGLEKVP